MMPAKAGPPDERNLTACTRHLVDSRRHSALLFVLFVTSKLSTVSDALVMGSQLSHEFSDPPRPKAVDNVPNTRYSALCRVSLCLSVVFVLSKDVSRKAFLKPCCLLCLCFPIALWSVNLGRRIARSDYI